jgi:hypothetical protein
VTLDELTALVAELRRQTVDTAIAMFYGMAQYRDADAVVFVDAFLPVLRAGQRTMAQLVAAYLAYSAAESLPVSTAGQPGNLILPPGIPDVDILDRDGVDMWEVYQRPFRTVWTQLAEGRPMTDAVTAGGTRVAEMTDMDLQQAESRAFRSGMERLPEQVRPRYWRRVLEGPESCALCVLASTRRYSRGDLKAVHPGCDCKVEPIYPGEGDPFAARDDELVARAHAAAAELTGAADAGGRRVDYRTLTTNITARHGEHEAPLLVRPLDRFTDPGDLPGDDPARRSATDRR